MGENLNKTVHISFTKEDFEKIKSAAKKLGMPVSVYVKMIFLKNFESENL